MSTESQGGSPLDKTEEQMATKLIERYLTGGMNEKTEAFEHVIETAGLIQDAFFLALAEGKISQPPEIQERVESLIRKNRWEGMTRIVAFGNDIPM